MTDTDTQETKDWVVPAIIVGVIAALAIVIAVGFAVNASRANDNSVAGQLERWTSCLRSEGVNVPLIESLRDGGVRITIDGSLLEGGLEIQRVLPALRACEADAPEFVKQFSTILDLMSFIPFQT